MRQFRFRTNASASGGVARAGRARWGNGRVWLRTNCLGFPWGGGMGRICGVKERGLNRKLDLVCAGWAREVQGGKRLWQARRVKGGAPPRANTSVLKSDRRLPARHRGAPKVMYCRNQRLSGTDALEFSFASETLREVCEVREAAVAALGQEDAIELARRLADLDASSNAAEYAEISGDVTAAADGKLTFVLRSGRLATLAPGNARQRLTETGAPDWSRVTRLRVESIEGVDG